MAQTFVLRPQQRLRWYLHGLVSISLLLRVQVDHIFQFDKPKSKSEVAPKIIVLAPVTVWVY